MVLKFPLRQVLWTPNIVISVVLVLTLGERAQTMGLLGGIKLMGETSVDKFKCNEDSDQNPHKSQLDKLSQDKIYSRKCRTFDDMDAFEWDKRHMSKFDSISVDELICIIRNGTFKC